MSFITITVNPQKNAFMVKTSNISDQSQGVAFQIEYLSTFMSRHNSRERFLGRLRGPNAAIRTALATERHGKVKLGGRTLWLHVQPFFLIKGGAWGFQKSSS